MDDLGLALDDHTTLPMLREVLDQAEWPDEVTLAEWVSEDAVDNLKFVDCTPRPLAVAEVEARLRDDRTVAEVLTEPMTSTHLP